MLTVYLVRHGIAEDTAASGLDQDRCLTTRGRKRIEQISRALLGLKLQPQRILTSPWPRAAETASIIAATLGCQKRIQERPELISGGTASGQIREWLDPAQPELLVVGHEPDLTLIAAELLDAAVPLRFKKGGICRIDLSAPQHPGALIWMLTPTILRACAR